jgi:hypothetical protein
MDTTPSMAGGYRRTARLLAAGALVIVVITQAAYLLREDFLKWTSGMALNTALCLILLGTAVLILSLRKA